MFESNRTRQEERMEKKTIVVSGINLFEGGTLRIYYNFCDELITKKIYEQYEFILFVHSEILFKKYKPYFQIIELPDSRSSWFKRIKYEYCYFSSFSKTRDIELWISLHDITPNVHAKHQLTYFHNPTFSHKPTYKDFKYSKKVFLFSLFYKYLYKLNVRKNDYVIVQQDWISREISRLIGIDEKDIIVMPAEKKEKLININTTKEMPYMFFFPSVSRHFKNFEVICNAVRILNERGYSEKFQVVLTIDGNEDRYAEEIVSNNSDLKNVNFTGYLPMEEVDQYYQKSSCLIFPSKMETWGLPISEAKQYHLPMLVADLPYAHETVGNYGKVCFFDVDNTQQLADLMYSAFSGNSVFSEATYKHTSQNVIYSWKDVIELVLSENKK